MGSGGFDDDLLVQTRLVDRPHVRIAVAVPMSAHEAIGLLVLLGYIAAVLVLAWSIGEATR